jgi:hypothetical protein
MSNENNKIINFSKIGKDIHYQILADQNKNIKNYISDILRSESLIEEAGSGNAFKQTIYNDLLSEGGDKPENFGETPVKKKTTTQMSFKNIFAGTALQSTKKLSTTAFKTSNFTRKSVSNLNVLDTVKKPTFKEIPKSEPGFKSLSNKSSSKHTNSEKYVSKDNVIHEYEGSVGSDSPNLVTFKKSKTIVASRMPSILTSSKDMKKLSKSNTIALNPKYLDNESFKGSDTNIAFDWRHSNLINKENKIKLKYMTIELKKSLQVNLSSSSEEDEEASDKTVSNNLSEAIKSKYKQDKRKLTKGRVVYDSCSDDEVMHLDDRGTLDPESLVVKVLEFIVLLGLLYTTLVTPIQLAFNLFGSFRYIIVEAVVDFTFILDLISGFYIQYYNFEEKLITSKRRIVWNYLATWMVCDFIAAIPANTFFAFLFKFYTDVSLITEITQVIILLRLLKYFKFFLKTANHFNLAKLFVISTNFTFFFSFLLYVTLTHFLTCVFIFLSKLEVGGWIDVHGFTDANMVDLYIASFYFNSATIFTIGYGDIVCRNIYERVYNVLLLMVGILVYSWAVSVLSNFVTSQDERSKKYQKRLGVLKAFKYKYNIRDDIYNKIARFLKYEYMIYKIDNNTLLSELPARVRNELMYNMYRDVIQNFIFFKNFENLDFINRVLLTLKPIKAIRNEIIFREGELVDETIFVKMGVLSLEVSINLANYDEDRPPERESILKKIRKHEVRTKEKGIFRSETIREMNEYKPPDMRTFKIIKLRRNEHFGDVLMFLNQPSPLTVRVKSKIAELLLLNKINLANIAKDYPVIFQKIYMKSVYNMDKIQLLIEDAKKILIENQKKEKIINNQRRDITPAQHMSTQGLNDHSINIIEEEPGISGRSDGKFNSRSSTARQLINVQKSNRSTRRVEYMIDMANHLNRSIDSSDCDDASPVNLKSNRDDKTTPSTNDIAGDYNAPRSFRYTTETTEQSVNDENVGDVSKKIRSDNAIQNNFKKKNLNFTETLNIVKTVNINITPKPSTKSGKNYSDTFMPLVDHAISFSIEKPDLSVGFSKFKTQKSAYQIKLKQRRPSLDGFNRGRTDDNISHSLIDLDSPEKKLIRGKRKNSTQGFKRKTMIDIFTPRPSIMNSLVLVKESNNSLSSFNSDQDNPDVFRRRNKMLTEVQKNIANSNMNLENPDSYYTQLLMDIKIQKEKGGRSKNIAQTIQRLNDKVVDRLGRLENLLKDKMI